MNKIIFVLITFSQSLSFCCEHTDEIKDYLRFKIDCIIETGNVRIMTREDSVRIKVYLEIIDYIESND